MLLAGCTGARLLPVSFALRFSRACARRPASASASAPPPPPPPLDAWRSALSAARPPRSALLPRGHPHGSEAAELRALLGDALLKAAVLRHLLAATDGGARVGDITSLASEALSNARLAGCAEALLLNVPGVDIAAGDLVLPVHGRATAVEAAAAAAAGEAEAAPGGRAGGGAAALAEVAAHLCALSKAEGSLNWKGLLLEQGGSVACEQRGGGRGGGFVATAALPGRPAASRASSEWPSKQGAEAEASRLALEAAGLATAGQRAAARARGGAAALEAAAAAAAAAPVADWLLSAPLRFDPWTVDAAALRGASEPGAASWLARGLAARGSRFQRLLGAPAALPGRVAAVRAWGAAVGGGGAPPFVCIVAVTTTAPAATPGGGGGGGGGGEGAGGGEPEPQPQQPQQRWFASPAAPTVTRAREAAAALAAHSLGLLAAAEEEAAAEAGAQAPPITG